MNSVEAATSSVYRASVCPRASAIRPPVSVLGFCTGGWRIRDAIVCTDVESMSWLSGTRSKTGRHQEQNSEEGEPAGDVDELNIGYADL